MITKLLHQQGAYVLTKAKCTHCGKDNHKSQDYYKIKTCPHCGKTWHAPTNRCYYKDKAAKQDNNKAKDVSIKDEENKDKGKGQLNFIEGNNPTPYDESEFYDDIC